MDAAETWGTQMVFLLSGGCVHGTARAQAGHGTMETWDVCLARSKQALLMSALDHGHGPGEVNV